MNAVKVCAVTLGLLNLNSLVLLKLHGRGISSSSYQVSIQCLNCLIRCAAGGSSLKGHPELCLVLSFLAFYIFFYPFFLSSLNYLWWDFDFDFDF